MKTVIDPKRMLGLKQVGYPVPYFSYIYTPGTHDDFRKIKRWIDLNLKSRYYLSKVNNPNKGKPYLIKIGLEFEKDTTLLILSCPNYNSI